MDAFGIYKNCIQNNLVWMSHLYIFSNCHLDLKIIFQLRCPHGHRSTSHQCSITLWLIVFLPGSLLWDLCFSHTNIFLYNQSIKYCLTNIKRLRLHPFSIKVCNLIRIQTYLLINLYPLIDPLQKAESKLGVVRDLPTFYIN